MCSFTPTLTEGSIRTGMPNNGGNPSQKSATITQKYKTNPVHTVMKTKAPRGAALNGVGFPQPDQALAGHEPLLNEGQCSPIFHKNHSLGGANRIGSTARRAARSFGPGQGAKL